LVAVWRSRPAALALPAKADPRAARLIARGDATAIVDRDKAVARFAELLAELDGVGA
jgi:hypothetical protein